MCSVIAASFQPAGTADPLAELTMPLSFQIIPSVKEQEEIYEISGSCDGLLKYDTKHFGRWGKIFSEEPVILTFRV